MPLPMPRPISGSRLAPKIRMTITRMTSISGKPIRPIANSLCLLLRGASRDLSTKGSACGRYLAGLLALLILLGPPVEAQFASGVQLVEVYVSVTDREGHPITGLTKRDFTVFENEQPQDITVFTAGEAGLSVAVALDHSFSMAGEPLDTMKRATDTFLDALKPMDRAMLIGIGSTVDVLAPLSTDRAEQHHAVQILDAFGSTSLRDAIVSAIDRIEPAPGRRALVLLSDGVDRYSQVTEANVIDRARRADVLAYPIAIASGKGAKGRTSSTLFVDLAVVTGGHSAQVTDPK